MPRAAATTTLSAGRRSSSNTTTRRTAPTTSTRSGASSTTTGARTCSRRTWLPRTSAAEPPEQRGVYEDAPNHSPWIAQLAPDGPARPVDEDLATDVAIVGAGIAGVVTAFFVLRSTSK